MNSTDGFDVESVVKLPALGSMLFKAFREILLLLSSIAIACGLLACALGGGLMLSPESLRFAVISGAFIYTYARLVSLAPYPKSLSSLTRDLIIVLLCSSLYLLWIEMGIHV